MAPSLRNTLGRAAKVESLLEFLVLQKHPSVPLQKKYQADRADRGRSGQIILDSPRGNCGGGWFRHHGTSGYGWKTVVKGLFLSDNKRVLIAGGKQLSLTFAVAAVDRANRELHARLKIACRCDCLTGRALADGWCDNLFARFPDLRSAYSMNRSVRRPAEEGGVSGVNNHINFLAGDIASADDPPSRNASHVGNYSPSRAPTGSSACHGVRCLGYSLGLVFCKRVLDQCSRFQTSERPA